MRLQAYGAGKWGCVCERSGKCGCRQVGVQAYGAGKWGWVCAKGQASAGAEVRQVGVQAYGAGKQLFLREVRQVVM